MRMKLSTRQRLWSTMTLVLAAAAALWMLWPNAPVGWAHLVGLGVAVALLILIWTWPGVEQPTKPPA
jgi:hypothetical protein